MRGGVGGEEQGFLPLPRQPDRGDARGDRLAHTALAGEEQRATMTIGLQARPHIIQGGNKHSSPGLDVLGFERLGGGGSVKENFSYLAQSLNTFDLTCQQRHGLFRVG